MAHGQIVAISRSDATAPLVDAVCPMLLFPYRLFEADGIGGAEMEAAILAGEISAVLDLTTAELASGKAGPNRMTAAAIKGIPQVLSLGGLDCVDGRLTSPETSDKVGQDFAQKACAARGPTNILIPLRGLSSRDNPEGNAALFQSIRNWVYGVELIEVDAHINDPAFAKLVCETLSRLMGQS
jgi:uncharacterized protein (UPF0261 family)